MSSRRHFTKSERYEAGESCSCNWGWVVPVASAVIGAAGSYLGSKQQADAQRDAMQGPWHQSWMYPDAETHADTVLNHALSLYQQGAFAPAPHYLDLEGRQMGIDYARSTMPVLIDEAQESWRQGLNPELNPYIDDMLADTKANLEQDFAQTILPRISSASQAVGGFGGSRQGVAEGIASQALTDAWGDAETRLRAAAHEQALAQQRAAWGVAPSMIGLGTMPGHQLMGIGQMYQNDRLQDVRNLMGYQSMISPYTQPQHQGGGPYATPVGPNPYTSILQGAAGGMGLYNMWNQYANPPSGGWGGESPLGGSGTGTGSLWDLYS